MADTGLIRIEGSSYYLPGRWAVGVYLDFDTRCAVLIDSGAGTTVAQQVDHAVKAHGCKVAAIIITHGHEVQFRGNQYFKEQYPDIHIYSTHQTGMYLRHKSISSSELPFGAPICEGNICMPDHSITDFIPHADGSLQIGAITLQILALPGHCSGMIGVITPDDVVYCSDAMFGYHTLSKQKLLYYTNIAEAKSTFRKLLSLKASAYVLYHGGCIKGMRNLVKQHMTRINETTHFILNLVQDSPLTMETIIEKVMRRYEVEQSVQQYHVANAITHAHVTELYRKGLVLQYLYGGDLYVAGSHRDVMPDTDEEPEHIIKNNLLYVPS